MAEHGRCCVHTEGRQEDVLFVLPPLCRELREGDTITHTDPRAQTTVYKIESVDFRIEQISVAGVSGEIVAWRPPEVWYGVSVVP